MSLLHDVKQHNVNQDRLALPPVHSQLVRFPHVSRHMLPFCPKV